MSIQHNRQHLALPCGCRATDLDAHALNCCNRLGHGSSHVLAARFAHAVLAQAAGVVLSARGDETP